MDDQRARRALRRALWFHRGQPIHYHDVAEVLAFWSGEDGCNTHFSWLLRLKDGRFTGASAWHDYTGWKCQSGMSVSVHHSREEAVALGLTLNDRCNLGLLLPGESIPDKEE